MSVLGLALEERPARRRASLAPMIDVVFLLLIFFLLASRFDRETVLPVGTAGGEPSGAAWQGPPRLVDVSPEGLSLNGQPVSDTDLVDRLRLLMPSEDAPVLLRSRDGADVQRLVGVIEALSGAGVSRLVLVE